MTKSPKQFHSRVGADNLKKTLAISSNRMGNFNITQQSWQRQQSAEIRSRQSVDRLLAILQDPRLTVDSKREGVTAKLKLIYQRLAFTEMANGSLGSEVVLALQERFYSQERSTGRGREAIIIHRPCVIDRGVLDSGIYKCLYRGCGENPHL
jgi:hypothetical protein